MLLMEKKPKADRHKHKPLTLRLPPLYRQKLEELAKRTRRTITEEAKIAFEEHLAKNGLWEETEGE